MNELAIDYYKFKTIDNEFTGLMKKVTNKPFVLEVINIPSIKSFLGMVSHEFEEIKFEKIVKISDDLAVYQ